MDRRLRPLAFAVGAVILASVLTSGVSVAAATRRVIDLPERFRGADQAVVGRVVKVEPVWQRTASGDELIVSRVELAVEETLKGAPVRTIAVDVEGGQIGDLVLTVSDLPTLRAGERAVVLVARDRAGRVVPHLRGLGILKLDERGMVPGSSLSLDMIREAARATGAR